MPGPASHLEGRRRSGRREVVTLSRFTADAAAALGGPQWLRERRMAALERFAAGGLPTTQEEVWRYSRIDDLDLEAYRPPGVDGGRGHVPALPDALTTALALPDRAGLLVTRNGRIVRTELNPRLEASGVSLGSLLRHSAGDRRLGSVASAPDTLVELSDAFMADAALLEVPDGVHMPGPVVVLHWYEGEGGSVFPHLVTHLGKGAAASVVEVFASDGGAGLSVPVTELMVGDRAELAYVGVQVIGPRRWQVAYQASHAGEDARLRSFSVALGGEYARVRTDSLLAGRGGSSELLAAYLGSADQMHDFRTLQDHEGPHTTSDLLFKGAVRDRAQSVYSGLIRVRRGAIGTNAFQTNRNLVLSEGAHTNSVPNLDIEENDVRCSHASAVGPIDEDQRYYLASRGIPPAVADRLIVLGFYRDILERVPVEQVKPYLHRVVEDELTGSEHAGEEAAISG